MWILYFGHGSVFTELLPFDDEICILPFRSIFCSKELFLCKELLGDIHHINPFPNKPARLGGSVVSILDSWPGDCEFDPWLRWLFFPTYFHLSHLQKYVRKSSPLLWKEKILHACSTSLWGKEKLLITSNFFFSHNVFTLSENFSPLSSISKLSSANSFSFGESKICRLGMG